MNKYRISFNDQRDEQIVEAKYPQFEPHWITFKDDDNKAVFVVNAVAVHSIAMVEQTGMYLRGRDDRFGQFVYRDDEDPKEVADLIAVDLAKRATTSLG